MSCSWFLWHRLRTTLPLLLDLLLLILLFSLDVRDLYYKIAWIGPTNSFAFSAISQRSMESKPLVTTMNVSQQLSPSTSEVVSTEHRASGWPALLSNCERLHAAGNPNLFIGAMGINCQVGAANKTIAVPQFYMSGSLRVDSMAWAACKLLYLHRQPTLCQTPMVDDFLDRYGFDDTEVFPDMLALPASDAEAELFALLDVIAKSAPLHRVTCVEGFAYNGAGFYKTHIYGCGAPNVYQSAFVGLHATAFKDLHQDKAWLTVDTIDLMGFKYIMRQNCYSEFTATVNATTKKLALQHKTITNFSSSGVLYCVMIVVDMLLMVITLWSAVEIARLMIVPLIMSQGPREDSESRLRTAVEDYKTVLTCSLYRSRPIVFLTVATQLLSWVIIIPNSTIWTWSTAAKVAKIQAYLSSLRLWVLILVLFNELWDWVVFFHERLAYAVSKRTYVASHEIIAVGAFVSYVKRQEIFAVTGTKYTMERQRNRDSTSFVNHTAFGNSYNAQLEGFINTPTSVLWVLYEPLVDIILWSILGIIVVVIVRLVVFELWRRLKLKRRIAQLIHQKTRPVPPPPVEVAEPVAISDQLFSKRNLIEAATPVASPRTDSRTNSQRKPSLKQTEYSRLPLEELLNVPIRARCLVRGTMEIEATAPRSQRSNRQVSSDTSEAEDRYIRAPFLLEHGVLLDHGRLRPRHGFFTFLQPKVELTSYVLPSTREALESFHGRRVQRKNWRQRLKWADNKTI